MAWEPQAILEIAKIFSDVLIRLSSYSHRCVKPGFPAEKSVIGTPIIFYLKRHVFEPKTFNICVIHFLLFVETVRNLQSLEKYLH